MIFRLLRFIAVSCCISAALFGQATTSLSGTVSDPSGAVVPGAKLTVTNTENSQQRTSNSDEQGRYVFAQLQPGKYKLTAAAQGFNEATVNDLTLLVSTPATVNIAMTVGNSTTTVAIQAEAELVNTSDATIGNSVGGQAITQLPFEGRNVVGLLAVQPGVVYLGEPDPAKTNDYRSGAVNGAKSDQANVTLDGVDVNDTVNGAAFKSVLRVTLDSVQEFRTITTNPGAEFGRSSGAQVTLVTKSGTNGIHGSAYEYIRNTATSANTFFNNAAGVKRATLNRNVYGASVGGPIRKNRLFYFANWEGRRDASQGTALRTIPNSTFRNGIFTYIKKDGTVGTIDQTALRALDPQGIGVSQAALADFKAYPQPNDSTVGDGLNTAGFRFNASTPLRWNTYVAKFDYTLDNSGKHTIFWRGNLQNDNYANGIAQLPGEAASSVYLENSKGFATGYTTILSASLVSNFHYGFTRGGSETTGTLTAPYASFTGIDTLHATTIGSAVIAPVHTIAEDMVWNKGAHTISFGGVARLISNRTAGAGAFSNALAKSVWFLNDGTDLLPADAKPSTAGENQALNIFGILSQLTTNQQYDKTGALLPQTTILKRNWIQHAYEFYLQDSYKVTRSLTVTIGLRYGINPAITEADGYQTSPLVPFNDFFNARLNLANQGKSQALGPLATFDLYGKPGTRGLYPDQHTTSPRVAIAYSPRATGGLAKFLFGGPGQTSIRAGWGMYYDNFGPSLARSFGSAQLGLSTSLRNPSGQSAAQLPRYAGFYSVPLSQFVPAPPGGFPQTYPPLGGNTRTIDDQIKSPYTMNGNISIGREFKGGFFVQASYVNREARRSLIGSDLAQPTNLVDTVSGMTYFQAAQQLATQALANGGSGVPVGNVQKIPFWENLWPGAASGTLTATQAIYQKFLAVHGDYTTALQNIDVKCTPSCSKLGPYSMFNAQYNTVYAFRSIGAGNYNGLEWTIRKRFSSGYQFDFNYTYSKSIDLGSNRESNGVQTSSGNIINSWFPNQNKGVSDYDTTHQFSALAVAQLPFGHGKMFMGSANRFVDAVIGGWQLSGIFRNTSGFAKSVNNGVGYPTGWAFNGYATQTGVVPAPITSENAPSALASGKGGPNIFAVPGQAFAAYSPTLPGNSGQRNGIRGDGVFGVDMSLGKRFNLFKVRDVQHSLQVRAEAFNVTNSVRFDIASANLDIANQARFGQYTQVLTQPRVFQFSGRYEW